MPGITLEGSRHRRFDGSARAPEGDACRCGGIDLVGAAQDAKEATELALAWKPDLLILDIHLRGGRGIDVLRAVKRAQPATVVIIATIFSSADDREAWLRRGADFFFDKSTEFEKIARVVRTLKLRVAPEPTATPD